ncbi:unnamed protein product [Phyllotreta striolata]|uniref:Uncharacterized protein n=1 Tax=Phyllotreta striolata TaxID=444603 RepID=A0A9N9XKK9_PHYSR|nr:unnamed protein product [Phyllotreta striolata]
MRYFTTTRLKILYFLILNELLNLALALPGTSKIYRNGESLASKTTLQAEPTCEELKAMWRFSKRQSRAAEITNEIPMYRDPFRENIWVHPYYATSRSMGGQKIGRYRDQPIFGRIVHNPPNWRKQNAADRYKAFQEIAHLYGMPMPAEPRRKLTTFRLPGGRIRTVGIPPVQGSFQHLKELIKTERARELEQQRAAEEAAARAAALKDLATRGKTRTQAYVTDDYGYLSDEPDYGTVEENTPRPGLLAFPDPAARPVAYKMMPDYAYTRAAGAGRSRAIFDNSFTDGYSGYLP